MKGKSQFFPRWFDPFEAIEVMTNMCRLKFSSSIKMDLMINVSHLKPYVEKEDGGLVQILKEPKIIDWAKDFDVKRILNHR